MEITGKKFMEFQKISIYLYLQYLNIAHLRQECHNSKFGIFWGYRYRKKRLQMHFLTVIVS